MSVIFLWILVFGLVAILLSHAYDIGKGDTNGAKLLDGLKQYFDLGYVPEEDENEQIARALDALAQRIIDRHGDEWTVTVEDGRHITITDGDGNVYDYTSVEGLLRHYKRD